MLGLPNQVNEVLTLPGVFRGSLDVRARSIDGSIQLAAANAMAAVIPDGELDADYIGPSLFNRQVAATASDVARRTGPRARAGAWGIRQDGSMTAGA